MLVAQISDIHASCENENLSRLNSVISWELLSILVYEVLLKQLFDRVLAVQFHP